jgi:uncharacterized membrane protein
MEPSAAASPAPRLPLIDAARGIAVAAMVVYHFCWDLRYFGFIAAEVDTALGWRIFAHAIAGAFLFIVGVSLVLASRRGISWRHYFRRLAVIVASALAITIVTWFTFPDAFIFFGILHEIAVASVLGLAFIRAPLALTVAAAVFCFAAPHFLSAPLFDHWALLWIGLSTTLPRTNDFVPVFPWFGAVLAGIAAAKLWPRLGLDRLALWRMASVPPTLLFVGRHSLLIYLLHQPILFGLTDLAARIYPPDLLSFEPAYLESCTRSCVESEVDVEVCRRTCGCIAEHAQAEGFWGDMMRQNLSVPDEMRYFALVDECRAAAETQ